jgi:hypothetical protein
MQNTKILDVVPTTAGRCLVTLERLMDGKVLDTEYPFSVGTFMRRLRDWQRGALIQNAFSDLNADEREFLMTGITPAEWAKMFGEEE